MVRLSSTFSLLAVLSVAASSLSMRIDARAPTESLGRRQITIPSITQAQFSADLSSTCPNVNTAVGSSSGQAVISSISTTVLNIEDMMSETALALSDTAGAQQLSSQWGSIIQQWQNVLQESNDAAESSVDTLQAFTGSTTEVLIQLVATGDSSEAITILQELEEGVAETILSQVQTISGGFVSLQSNVAAFSSALPNGLGVIPSGIVGQLNNFTEIWNAVASDNQKSTQLLANLLTGNSGIEPLIFWPIVEEVTCIYEKLTSAFQSYETAT